MVSKFNTGDPIAYFLTWTTYGTWLPGDERGWNRKCELGGLPANRLFQEMASADLLEVPFLMNHSERGVVEATIRKHCEVRSWELHASSVRSNHVHVVVKSPGYQPEAVSRQFKAWCTRRLKQTHSHRKKFWTQGSSCRWINTDDELLRVIEYTLEAQDRKGIE